LYFQAKNISISRVFILLSVALSLAFIVWPHLSFSQDLAPSALRILGTAYLNVHLLLLSVVGAFLCLRGEPIGLLAIQLFISPMFLVFVIASPESVALQIIGQSCYLFAVVLTAAIAYQRT
jgi:hypothetical protein